MISKEFFLKKIKKMTVFKTKKMRQKTHLFIFRKLVMPPARLERATHSLAYLTWFPKPHFPKKTVESLDYILDISV